MKTLNHTKGIIFMISGIFWLAAGESILKLLTVNYTPFQIILIRSLISIVILLLVWRRFHTFSDIFQVNIKDQLLRTGAFVLSLLLAIYSLSLIPLFQYSSIFFSAPFFMVLFSSFLLREPIDKSVLLALILGFLGVIFVFNPSEQVWLAVGSLAALFSALFYGLGMVLTNKLCKLNSPLLMTIWYTMTCLVLGLSGCFSTSFTFRVEDGVLYSVAALTNVVGNLCISRSFQFASVSYLAPLEYIAIPISLVLSYLLWDYFPDNEAFIGVFLIIGSGVYIIRKRNTLDHEFEYENKTI